MEKKAVTLASILTVAGTYLAFVIGSGFSSGQEILQYFTVHGYGAFLAILVYFIVAVLMDTEFIRTGQREQFERQDGIYKYYCGKWLGTFYDYFSNLFLYMSFIVMLSGSGAALQQHYGAPAYIGVFLTAIIVGLTVTLGMGKIADILGKIGPVLIIVTVVICISNIFMGPFSIRDGIAAISDLGITSSSSTWYLSVFNYLGFSILWAAPFLSTFGKTLNSQKEAVIGQIVGELLFSLTCLIVVIAMLTNITQMSETQIPTLALSVNISPVFGSIFTVIILLSIYSTAVPLLYLPTTRFVNEKTKKGKATITIMSLIGAIVALTLPFNQLVNFIYVINGYIGVPFLVFVFIKVIRRTMVTTAQTKRIEQYSYKEAE